MPSTTCIMGYRVEWRKSNGSLNEYIALTQGEIMFCHCIATARNGKIRKEPIYRSCQHIFDLIFINIQASRPHLDRTHSLDFPLEKQNLRNEPRLSDAKSQFGLYFHI